MKLKHVPDFKGERGQRMIDSYNELPDASDRPNIPRILIRAVTPSLYYLGLVLAGCGILQAAIMVPLFFAGSASGSDSGFADAWRTGRFVVGC